MEKYNRPTATFRSGAYIVLMVIAWATLFHAIFIQKHKQPFYRKKNSKRFERINGDYKAWELAECVRQFYGANNPSEKENLTFFIGRRNKIEHRSLHQIDSEIFGECQSLLMNFEELLCGESGRSYALKTGFVYALQFFHGLQTTQPNAMTKLTKKQYHD